jgi:serine/threonine protein kinase/formylglycine-generating enzyme required for sulfatase activity
MKECPTCRTCFPDDVVYCPDDAAETTASIAGEPILDGRYQLEKRLGQGGMGVVYKARHIFLKTSHAIKIILPDLVGNDPNLVTRFRQEALAAAAIRHQNIIAVTDFGVVRGTMPFLVMEFVQGKSLQEIMAEDGAMSPVRAFELMQPICAGIAAAHRQGIVHRDLKPLNVMIQDELPISEAVKILDFGLAKIKSGELLGSFIAAQTTGLMGSPFYMAPEQWSDEPPDARADVYSLGVMLFQMLCGEVPFKGSSIPSIMKKHLTADVPSLASKGADVPPHIEECVRHALEKEPAHRTPSADEFSRELREAMSLASARLKRTDSSAAIDPSKTIVAPASETVGPTGSTTAFDPNAGTISAASLAEEDQKTLFAQRELAREAAHRKKLAEEQEQERKAEDRKRQDEEAEKQKERKQLEEIVAAQTKVLEEKLTQLASTMTPKAPAAIDPEATQMQRAGITTGNVSLSGTAAQFPRVDVELGRKKSFALPVAIVVVLVLLIGGGIGGYLLLKSKSPTSNGPNKPTDPTEAPIKWDLVEIPGGTFQMGKNGGLPQEGPAHNVTVNAFSMDKNEVTNAEYAQFIRESNHQPPEHWGGIKPPVGEDSLPASNITYDDALAFAAWRSKRDNATYRLPSDEEWEYSARNGDKANLYPWGNTWQSGRAATTEAGVRKAQPVGSYREGGNQWGIQDLMGNVWEFTSTKASVYPGNPATLPEQFKDWIVVRGGSFQSQAKGDRPVSSTLREWVAPNYKSPTLGFRLVKVRS